MIPSTTPKETRLANGIRVVTEAMPHIASAALSVHVGAGARIEREEEHGIAHLLEHMAFKGTRRRSAQRIVEEIEAVGGEINAATSMEHTTYYARVLSPDLPLALDILADIVSNSVLDTEEIKREQGVIRQEIAAVHDTPDDLVFEHLQAAAFPNQPLGRSILGTQASVASFTRDHVKGFLDAHYHGARIVVAAAGNLDHADLVARVEDALGALPASVAAAPSPAHFEGGEKREERGTEQVNLALAFPGEAMTSERLVPARIFANLLGGGMASRLFQEVREKRGLCYAVSAFHWAYADTGLFGLHAATDEEQIAELVPVMLDVLSAAARDASPEEIARAKNQARAGLLMSLESPAARADRLARQILGHGRLRPVAEMAATIERVGVDEVRQVAADMLRAGRMAVASVGRTGEVGIAAPIL